MIQNSQIPRHDLVLKDSSGWNVNPVPVVGDDDDCSSETDYKVALFMFDCNLNTVSPPFPKVTSPDTVRWSNSNMSGIEPNL